MTIKINTYFTNLEIDDIKKTMKELLEHNQVGVRDRALSLYLSGEADPRDRNGIIVKTSHDLASRAWTMAVLMHLHHKGYEVKKK